MKDENIKEILDEMINLNDYEDYKIYGKKANEIGKLLLDYITTLQEELEHYKQLGLNQKQFEYENKIKILEHNCKQAEDSCRQHRLANKNKKRRLQRREEQINLYKTRIDKAIETIELWDMCGSELITTFQEKAINILKGKSDE